MSNLTRVIKSHIAEFQDQLYTSIPAIVKAYDPLECTVDVLPAILKVHVDGLKLKESVLQRVPVQFPCVGDAAITLPIKVGDKVMIHFCHSNIDNFFDLPEDDKTDGTVEPRLFSKHSVNDCFVTVGIRKYSNTPVKRVGTFDIYFKDSRLTFSEDGKIEVELDNPDSGVNSQIVLDIDGKISLLNNKESSSVILEADGNISGVTKSKFSMDNGTVELVDALSRLAEQVSAITTNTVYGISPINNKAAVEAIKAEIDSMKV